jgi:glycosyltransferase involved in cell wall biosynthesis
MASGRPVIASSKVGGARDLVAHGGNGWVFEAGNLEALAGVLNEALGMGREGLFRLGRAAQRASDAWTTEISAVKIAEAVLSHFDPMRNPADAIRDLSGKPLPRQLEPTPNDDSRGVS